MHTLNLLVEKPYCTPRLSPIDISKPKPTKEKIHIEILFFEVPKIVLSHLSESVFVAESMRGFAHVIGSKGIFSVEQIYFKFPTEHQINSERYPLEIQALATNSDEELLIFSAIVIKKRKKSVQDEILKPILKEIANLPLNIDGAPTMKELNNPFRLETIFSPEYAYLYYEGDSTSPPCKKAIWLVSNTPIYIYEEYLPSIGGSPLPLAPIIAEVAGVRLTSINLNTTNAEKFNITITFEAREERLQTFINIFSNKTVATNIEKTSLKNTLSNILSLQTSCPTYLLQENTLSSVTELPNNCVYLWMPEVSTQNLVTAALQEEINALDHATGKKYQILCFLKNFRCGQSNYYIPLLVSTPDIILNSTSIDSLRIFSPDNHIYNVTLPVLNYAEDSDDLMSFIDLLPFFGRDQSINEIFDSNSARKDNSQKKFRLFKDSPFWPNLPSENIPEDCMPAWEGVDDSATIINIVRPTLSCPRCHYSLFCYFKKTIGNETNLLLPFFIKVDQNFTYGEVPPHFIIGTGNYTYAFIPSYKGDKLGKLIDVEQLLTQKIISSSQPRISIAELKAELSHEYQYLNPASFYTTYKIVSDKLGPEEKQNKDLILSLITGIFSRNLKSFTRQPETFLPEVCKKICALRTISFLENGSSQEICTKWSCIDTGMG